MQVLISRKDGHLSESLKEYIETSILDMTQYFDKLIDAHVTVDKENKASDVRIDLRVPGATLVAHGKSSNMRAAIDSASDRLEKQLHKYKEKLQRKLPTKNGNSKSESESGEVPEVMPVDSDAVITFSVD